MKLSIATTLILGLTGVAHAESAPKALARGEAPILFTQGVNGAVLRDGTVATTDEIYLWVPETQFSGAQVDLISTGRFFKIWDSGSTGGAANNVLLGGNDDESNEMRCLHFESSTGTFLISYDDSITTGFIAPHDSITDGTLLRMTPTGTDSNSLIDDWTLATVFVEGVVGTPGVLSDADVWGLGIDDADGTLIWSGASTTLLDLGGLPVAKGTPDLAHTEGLAAGAPRHIETSIYFAGVTPLNPGQFRGVDVLNTGELLISVSNQYKGDGVNVDLDRWDIGALDPVTGQAEVVYPGELFFQTIGTGTSEMLDFAVLDTADEINALLEIVGPTTDAGLALRAFADPPLGGFGETMLLTNVAANGLTATIRTLDLTTGEIIGTFVDDDWANNGQLYPVNNYAAGPNGTVLVAQTAGEQKVAQYDATGNYLGNYLEGEAIRIIGGLSRSADGGFMFTSDTNHDDIHRFDYFDSSPRPSAGDPLGVFVVGGLPPPNLQLPKAIEVLANGNILVGDLVDQRLKLFDSSTGAYLGEFTTDPIIGDVLDIDEQPNGDIVIAQSGSGNRIARYDSGGVLIEAFGFSGPAGVHLLPSGNYVVSSFSSFGQGKGLFLVSPSGSILMRQAYAIGTYSDCGRSTDSTSRAYKRRENAGVSNSGLCWYGPAVCRMRRAGAAREKARCHRAEDCNTARPRGSSQTPIWPGPQERDHDRQRPGHDRQRLSR